jgi:hypothetical protein
MSIITIDNFQVNISNPIDNRFVVGSQSITSGGIYPTPFYKYKEDISYKYPGLRIWDFNENVPYFWNGSAWINENTTGAIVENAASGSGTGFFSYLAKFKNNTTLLTKSWIYDTGSNIGIGLTGSAIAPGSGLPGLAPVPGLHVAGNIKTNNRFVGNGSLITQINATNITTGSLNLARITTPTINGTYLLRNITPGSTSWVLSSSIIPTIPTAFNLLNTTTEPPNASGTLITVGDISAGLSTTTNRYEFKPIISQGLLISPGSNNVRIESRSGENLGNGVLIYKGLNTTTKLHEFRTLNSSDIKVELDTAGNVINLSLPQSSSVPSIYINQDYIPSYDDWLKANKAANNGTAATIFNYKGEGTLAKPFTNTGTYNTSISGGGSWQVSNFNSSIQNGLDYYEGAPGNDGNGIPYSRSNPRRFGQKVQILAANGQYTFLDDFEYRGLDLEIYSTVACKKTGAIVNLNSGNFQSDSEDPNQDVVVTINIIGEQTRLYIEGTGFFNYGNNISAINYRFRKQIVLLGTGRIASTPATPNTTVSPIDKDRYIINAGSDAVLPPGFGNIPPKNFRNAGHATFVIKVDIECKYQGIIISRGSALTDFTDNQITSGSVNDNTAQDLEAIKITGGRILFIGVSITLFNQDPTQQRTYGIVFDAPSTAFEVIIIMRNCTFGGRAGTWFYRKGVLGIINVSDCSTLYFDATTLFGTSGNRVWGFNTPANPTSVEGNVVFQGNVIEGNTKIDFTKVYFQGYGATSNLIGLDVILSLRVFPTVIAAKRNLPPIPLGGAFIRRVVLTAPSQIATYRIGDEFFIFNNPGNLNFSGCAIGGTITDGYFQYNGQPVQLGGIPNSWPPLTELYYDQISVVS